MNSNETGIGIAMGRLPFKVDTSTLSRQQRLLEKYLYNQGCPVM